MYHMDTHTDGSHCSTLDVHQRTVFAMLVDVELYRKIPR